MHIIYKVTYLPHLNTAYPKYYIGSKFNWKGNYLGSVSSSRAFEFTNNLPLKTWWKNEQKYSDRFRFEIIRSFEDISTSDLVLVEREIHLALNVAMCHDYFNQCIALRGFVSSPKSKETKKRMSDSAKAYWDSIEGQEKSKRLSERNKSTKSVEMKNIWQNDEYKKKMSIKASSRTHTNETKLKCKLQKVKDIEYKSKIYRGWEELQRLTDITPFLYKKYYLNGYEPEVNIGTKIPKLILLESN